MGLNTSDLLEPEINEQIPTPLSSRLSLISPCSKRSVATSDLLYKQKAMLRAGVKPLNRELQQIKKLN